MNHRLKIGWIAAAVVLPAVAWIVWKGNSSQGPIPQTASPVESAPVPAAAPAAPAPVQTEQDLAQADASQAAQLQQRLGEASIQKLLHPSASDADAYVVQAGDTLSKIARKSNTTVELLKISNGLKGDMIRLGQPLKITRAKFSVIVDKSQNLLTLKNGEEVVKVYRCSTGLGGITPVGDFKIVSRMVDPIWKGVVPPGAPENPLGTRWLGFDLPEYGIHGTNEPDTVGQPVTKGCVRLLNSDVEELYVFLPVGTAVIIVE